MREDGKPVIKITDTYLSDEDILFALKTYYIDYVFLPHNTMVGKDSKGFFVRSEEVVK